MVKTIFKLGLVLILLAGAAAAWLHFSESPAIKAERFAAQARAFEAEGKREESLVVWRRAVALDPTKVSHRVELARNYLDSGKLDAAIRELELALQLDDANVEARKLATETERRRGNFQAVGRHARVLAIHRPFEGFLLLARGAAAQGDIRNADRWYRRAMSSFRSDPAGASRDAVEASEAALEWSRVIDRSGPGRAAAVREARELAAGIGRRSEKSRGWFAAALALEEAGDFGAAAELLDKVLAAEPVNLPATLARARVARGVGDTGRASILLRQAATRGPDAAVRAAKTAAAWKEYELALGLVNGVRGDAAFGAGVDILVEQGRHEEALELARSVHQSIHAAAPLLICGMALRRAGQDKLAEQALLDAAMAEPERPDIASALAALRSRAAERTKTYEDFQRAESDFLGLIAVNPSEPSYRWALGELYEKFGRAELAVRAYVEAARDVRFFRQSADRIARLDGAQWLRELDSADGFDASDDRPALIHRLSAVIELAAGRAESALASIHNDQDPASVLLRAEILEGLERREEALETIVAGIGTVPARGFAGGGSVGAAITVRHAGLLLELGRPDRAREVLTGVDARERNAEHYVLLGRAVEASGGRSFDIDREGWFGFGDDPRTGYRYAQALVREGKREEALVVLATAPLSVLSSGLEGELRAARGEVEEAAECCIEQLRSNPDSIMSYSRLASLVRQDGRAWADAAGGTENWIVETVRGIRAQAAGEATAAERHFLTALAAGGGTVAMNNLAWIRLEQGKHEEAENLARAARQRAPRSPTVADTLGWIAFRKGELDQARMYLEEANTKGVNDPTHCYHLARVYAEVGREKGAIENLYRRAVAARPQFAEREAFEALLSGKAP